MLATTSRQLGFFDAAELAWPLPEGSFFALLAEHGERIVRDEDFAACYAQRMGRPSIPPSQLAKVLLLQYRTGASDEAAMECVAWDLRWKVALGLPVDHEGWHPTSLTNFRARLLLHELERVRPSGARRGAASWSVGSANQRSTRFSHELKVG
jgi:transposase